MGLLDDIEELAKKTETKTEEAVQVVKAEVAQELTPEMKAYITAEFKAANALGNKLISELELSHPYWKLRDEATQLYHKAKLASAKE